jgi:tetratricopeptide (TPR) repeat protein
LAFEREAFGGLLIGAHVASLALIRLKDFEQALLTARSAEPLARYMSKDGSPSTRWTLIYGGARGAIARGLMKDPREGAKEEGLATGREAEDIIRKMYKVHPAMSTATRLVLQIINLGTVLFESKELVSAFDQAEAAMQILRQNKLRDPHHLAVVTWALSCHGRWSTAVGRMAEAVNGNQETMVHIWWVPSKHRQRLTQIHVPVLDTLLLRRRTYDILENFGDPWPLGDYYKTTDNARDCFKISPIHNGFLLGDCLSSQAWAVFNKNPDYPEKPVKLELEALQRFDWYKDYQHPRAHFQAIRSLCMLTTYYATAGDLDKASEACEKALDRTRRANHTLRRAILVEAAGWVDEHGLRLIKDGRVEDGARLKATAWKLRSLLLEICVANAEDESVFSGGFRPPTQGVQDDRNSMPDIAEVLPLPPSPIPGGENVQIPQADDGNTVNEGSSTPTAAVRPRLSVSSASSPDTSSASENTLT